MKIIETVRFFER